jgi:hypothetical protein
MKFLTRENPVYCSRVVKKSVIARPGLVAAIGKTSPQMNTDDTDQNMNFFDRY